MSLQERLVGFPFVLQALTFSGNGYYLATGQGTPRATNVGQRLDAATIVQGFPPYLVRYFLRIFYDVHL